VSIPGDWIPPGSPGLFHQRDHDQFKPTWAKRWAPNPSSWSTNPRSFEHRGQDIGRMSAGLEQIDYETQTVTLKKNFLSLDGRIEMRVITT